MRFSSKFINARYTVGTHAPHYEFHGQHREMVQGLFAQFVNYEYDSETAQKSNHWSDEQRVIVEDWLKQLDDFALPEDGGKIWLTDSLNPGDKVLSLDRGTQCLFLRPTPDGTERCPDAVAEGTDFCPTHLRLFQIADEQEALEAQDALEAVTIDG